MARGDGIHRTTARNARMKDADIGNAQAHNEREKSSYVNQDIVPERTPYNVHFKTPTVGYKEMFEQMRSDGVISTRGLKADAEKFGELIFDVNSAYFFNHGGYDFAKQFYADAYKAAIKIVGGEQYILSAVMHADERNRAMSDALGQDVYHYHLHVVYLPVVEKQILWSKRCKDETLRGTVKEIIQQVSMSKKWDSKPALDENGEPILSTKGKPVLKKSYSVLQDDFFRYMRDAGYDDVERGERGSSEEHLTVTQFKVQQEQARLAELAEQNRQQEQQAATLGRQIEKIQNQQVAVAAIEKIEAKPVPLSSKVILERSEYESLAVAAKKYVASEKKESKLQKALDAANRLIAKLTTEELSPRFLDRSWVIMLEPTRIDDEVDEDIENCEDMISFAAMKAAFCIGKNDVIDEAIQNKWNAVQKIFRDHSLQIMPRNQKMVKNYCAVGCRCMERDTPATKYAPLDYAFSQKILPTINGNGENYRLLIEDLLKECTIQNIIQDNKNRFPAPFSTMPDYQLQLFIDGSVKAAKERLRRNYKIAVPQYFITAGTIQLLIPLCLAAQDIADLAIVVEDYGNMYRASTCLTLDQAMNNARLLARPDRDWLNP